MSLDADRIKSASRETQLPAWRTVLVVVAHPDDETFGLGAIVGQLAASGASVHILCFSRGEASTLNAGLNDLRRTREAELREASALLGAASVILLGYPDGQLAALPDGVLDAHVQALAVRIRPDGLLVFDDTGVTGHCDHRAATAAAVRVGTAGSYPVLAWTVPASLAAQLRRQTGQPFAGQPPDRLEFRIPVNRDRQRRAARLHASQISPDAVLWQRLRLQGDIEHLRWLVASPTPVASPPNPALAGNLPTSPLLERIRRGIIGEGALMGGPFGPKRVTYADYTASGRSLDFIEDIIRDTVLPRYANTHTESSGTGLQTTRLREEARQIIHHAVGGTIDDLVIFCGSGPTWASGTSSPGRCRLASGPWCSLARTSTTPTSCPGASPSPRSWSSA